ncbi:MAG TPA: HAD family phosphatase [Dehalococcoidia bacterium]|nr:HAD family phosphatase [Dehalococcoidia bacterium]
MSDNHLQAVLWDLDGVIADTGIYHCRAWQDVFSQMGIEFTEEHFMRHFGQRNDTIIRDTVNSDISQDALEAIADKKEKTYRRLVADNIEALPGAIELLASLREHGIKSAIASSAPPENVRIITEGLGIEGYFNAIACGREVTEGKPSPQIFLLAAEKLNVEPSGCVVIEDAIAGIAGAKQAGMKCIAVANSHPQAMLNEADLIVASLESVSVDDLSGLYGKE